MVNYSHETACAIFLLRCSGHAVDVRQNRNGTWRFSIDQVSNMPEEIFLRLARKRLNRAKEAR